MGNELTEKPTAGTDCTGVFPAGETPDELMLVLSDIDKCSWLSAAYPDMPNGSLIIPQYTACAYLLNIYWPIGDGSYTQFHIDFSADTRVINVFMGQRWWAYMVKIFQGTFTGLEAECENLLACQAPGPGIPSWEIVGGNNGSAWVGYI